MPLYGVSHIGLSTLDLDATRTFYEHVLGFRLVTIEQIDLEEGGGGQESACGWCKDKWGLSWQITPIALTKAITDPDPAVAKRAFDAMMQMKKIDIAAIEAARRG